MCTIPPDVRRILVVRLSARGDVALSSPLAGALRRRHPAAHIAWAVEERTADVIRHNPHLDEVIVWERAGWKRMLRTGRWGEFLGVAMDFFTGLRDRRFDVAIDAQGLLRSGALAFISGAPVRIGLGSREGSQLLMTKVVKREFFTRRIASADAVFAEALGLDASLFRMEIPRGPDELAAVDRIVREEGLVGGFVAAVPFTTRFYKHWLEDRWSALIRRIRERAGLGVVLLGGPADRAAADRIMEGGANGPVEGAPLVDLVGRTTLGEASAVVSRCSVLVGVDTGLSHMAHAYGRPTVLIFGSNAPYLDPPTPDARILHSGRDCSPCWGKLTCDGRIDCMRDISVDKVLAAVRTAIA
ncbi:MAG: glycosyltransferase family 9 protein [Gemmatimonadota bacterium]|nr:glycosyltransferase family 9 protein [Gemmatimonadota bacterium]